MKLGSRSTTLHLGQVWRRSVFSPSLEKETGQLSLAHVNVWTARMNCSIVTKIEVAESGDAHRWCSTSGRWLVRMVRVDSPSEYLRRTSLEELTTFRRQVFSHYPNVEAGPTIAVFFNCNVRTRLCKGSFCCLDRHALQRMRRKMRLPRSSMSNSLLPLTFILQKAIKRDLRD